MLRRPRPLFLVSFGVFFEIVQNCLPAVDYHLSGGIGYEDLTQLLEILLTSGKAVGMDITIFNPKLDSDGSIARRLVSSLVAGLSDL